ncbi:tetrathionate reductase family octaheme c-type cytochrome [Myxococcota bacterium]|nr:tetrathionate reductase family octaheme c-type cytochrome [Myxococcota bacterium]MBU1432629.1 tetrathionate reductase family octaheme c-type cytochrome [Myxococcota bacterium]MBU1899508.1 tetrathionate reductase family octaheme c-type cytochrome [Myxococcota bacterium]
MAGEPPPREAQKDDPRAALPQRSEHVDHRQFFNAEDFADVRDDVKQIAHRLTQKCLDCHPDAAESVMATSHWHWRGEAMSVPGKEEKVRVGKANLINNFCISVQSNWPRCTSCHIGYGWEDANFNFEDEKNIDCLVCHESTGTYVKPSGDSGYPEEPKKPEGDHPNYKVDYMLNFAKSVNFPSRDNCGTCHFAGGGGDAVKHGDLNGFMYNPSENIDIHMGRHNLNCVDCHRTENHEIKGRSMGVSFDPKNLVRCTDCHSEQPHQQDRLNAHTHTVACQTCHIPTFAKGAATKMWWDWSEAGMTQEAAMKKFGLTDPHDYNPIKGVFKYASDVEPEYYWYNGHANRHITGDKIDDPTKLLSINYPLGDVRDPNARIFPFKVHRGKQPYDTYYKHLLVPKTYGEDGFWGMTEVQKHDIQTRWHISFKNGAAEHGLKYRGSETDQHTFGWLETEMFWPQTHMVASADEALQCNDCHTENGQAGRLDWKALGYEGDPARQGGRLQMNLIDQYEGWTREEWRR